MSQDTPTLSQKDIRLAKARAYKAAHRDEVLKKNREYNRARLADPLRRAVFIEQTNKSKRKHAAKWKDYDRARDPQKLKARNQIRQRIHDGRLIRGACVICQRPNAQAHHDDYSKPFEIHWLCQRHHNEAHKNPAILIGKEATHVK